MINAELLATIKAEIERRKSLLIQHSKLTYDLIIETFIKEYDDLFSFLSTLESEKPMNLDLEIEIEDYVEQRWQFAENLNAAVPIYLYDMTLNELKDCARHFAKWGAEHLKK